MKFAEHLSAHITPEWRKQYISYELMKEMLYAALDSLPNTDQFAAESVYQQYVVEFDEQFFEFCEKELTKINSFFAEKLAEAIRKFGDLKNELNTIKPSSQNTRQFHMQHHQIMQQANAATSNGNASNGTGNGSGLNLAQSNHLSQSSHLSSNSQNIKPNNNSSRNQDTSRKAMKKMHDLKLAFSEFYLGLVLLQNYQTLNFTGFRKILKKHDKLLNTGSGNHWRQNHVDTARFYTCNEVVKLIEETENVFTNVLEEGDRSKAMKRLRVPPLNAQQSLWTTFRVGLFSGAFLVLVILIIFSVIVKSRSETINFAAMCRLFRGPFFICLFTFLIGMNVYGWRTSGVNHVLIFELDPRDHVSEQHLFEVSFFFFVIWALSLLGYIYSSDFNVNQNIFPLINIFTYVIFIFNPTKTFKHQARFWLLRILSRVFLAPFFHVTFADFWLADQLNSLSILFSDFVYYVCFYVNFYYSDFYDEAGSTCMYSGRTYLIARAIATALPAWFRFAQCLRRYRDDNRSLFPHVVNAGKYSTSFFVVLFSVLTEFTVVVRNDPISSPFFALWIISLVVSSVYTYSWDIRMDWGLMDKNSNKEYCLLREEIVYPSPNYYYFAYVEDFICRTMWAFSISMNHVGAINGDILSTATGTIELCRRFIWNFFRLENEHLNNCGEFRAVRDISIAPIAPMGLDENSDSQKKDKKKKNKNKLRRSKNYSINNHNSSTNSYQDNGRPGEVALLMDNRNTKYDYDKL